MKLILQIEYEFNKVFVYLFNAELKDKKYDMRQTLQITSDELEFIKVFSMPSKKHPIHNSYLAVKKRLKLL